MAAVIEVGLADMSNIFHLFYQIFKIIIKLIIKMLFYSFILIKFYHKKLFKCILMLIPFLFFCEEKKKNEKILIFC